MSATARVLGRRTARLTAVFVTVLGTVGGMAYAATGIDIASYQHGTAISWSKVKGDGVKFVFIKATEGTSYTNPYYQGDWSSAGRAGIYRGAYHFARPSTGSAASQARYFVSRAGSFTKSGDLPPVLDLEVTGGLSVTSLQAWTSTWLQTVEDLTGRTPIIYCSPSFWTSYLGNSSAFHRYPLWVAHYTSASQPWVPGGWPTWTFWQNTSSGRVSGISGNVDMNRFNGSNAALARMAQVTGSVPSDPDPTGPTVPQRTPTQTSMTASSSNVTTGDAVTFRGTVTAGKPAVLLKDAPVRLARRPDSSQPWERVTTTVTGPTGTFSFQVTPDATADWRAKMPKNASYGVSRSVVARIAVSAAPTTRSATSIDLQGGATVSRAQRTRIFGHVTDAAGRAQAGRSVTFYRRPVGATSWTYLRTVSSVSPTGWYQTYVSPRRTREFRAVVVRDDTHRRATSNVQRLAVR